MKVQVVAIVVAFFGLSIGCSVPEKIKKDIGLIQKEEKILYEFNQKLLKSLQTETEQDLQKQVDLLTISRIAHHRVNTAAQLLGEYLDSTEYLVEADVELGENIVELIKKVREKLQEDN